MSAVLSQDRPYKELGERVRSARAGKGISSLDQFADRIKGCGVPRPSTAKLSRIETGVQPVPLDILPAVSEITGVAAARLRPDLATMFNKREVAK